MAGTGGIKYIDMELLAKGVRIPEPENTNYFSPALQTTCQPQYYYPQNQMQFVPITQAVPFIETKAQETYEPAEEYLFWEEERNFEIHVEIRNKAQRNQANSNRRNIDYKTKHKDVLIACFLVDSITKVITDELEQDTIKFEIQCRYYDKAARQAQTIEIAVDEETFSGDHLVQAFKKAFGSKHAPFPPKKNQDLDALLSKYLMDRYHKSPNELHITPQPDLNGIGELSDPERKSIVRMFYKIYDADNCGMGLLLTTGFGAVCRNQLDALECKTIPAVAKVIMVYGCGSNEQQNAIAALCCTSSEICPIMKLSGIKVTAKQDELRNLFFQRQYQPLLFADDTISDYAKRQNIAKIQRISEYVCNGIQRADNSVISCSAVVFTSRKLSDFREFAENCIFIDASEIPKLKYDAEEIKIIVSKFLNLLYENADYYLKSHQIQRIQNDTFGIDISQEKITMIYKIYHYIAQELFDNYGIGNSEADFVLNRCQKKRRKPIAVYLNENSAILSHDTIAKSMIDNLNKRIQNNRLCVKLYDKSLTAMNQALLYEHIGEAVLLFSNEYFEELFPSLVVDYKRLRELLNERGCSIVNYQDKSCFRMPIDERKLYTAIKVSALDDKSKEMLPYLHPVWIPDLNDGIDRIFLANDEHGNPIYWSVGRMENRSVLVQGNTRMGKTYFTTTKLIMGLHNLGYRVLIFDSAMSSYSDYELSKCGFDEAFIEEHFCHGTAENAVKIMNEFENSLNKVYIVNSDTDDCEKQILCDLLFKYQKKQFDANLENTIPLFVVFEEAGDNILYDEREVKRIYNQGSKMRLSTITILQMFTGKGSERFRRMAGQSLLKISFKCSTDRIKYLTETIPPEVREMAKSRLPMLGVGEALICGEFEKPDGSLESDSYIIRRD